jgi:hypothetical protein
MTTHEISYLNHETPLALCIGGKNENQMSSPRWKTDGCESFSPGTDQRLPQLAFLGIDPVLSRWPQ